MDLVTFVISLNGFIFLAFALFFSVVALALHEKLSFPAPVAFALGLVFQWVGIAAMIAVNFFRAAKNASDSFQTAPAFGQHNFNAAAHQDPFAADTSTEPTPGFEANPAAPISRPVLILAALAVVFLAPSIFLNWFYSITEAGGERSVGLLSTGLELWLILTAIALVAGVFLSNTKYAIVSPILIGYFAAWWTSLSIAAVVSRFEFIQGMSAVFQLPNLIISVGAQQVVSQRVGEAWLMVLAAGLVMLGLSYMLALTRSESRTNSF